MTNRPRTLRVGVLGGGVLGVSTAAELARRGAQVFLVTEAVLASQASGRSLSWLNSFGLRSHAYHQLRLCGLNRYRSFLERFDASGYVKFDGGLTWASARQDAGHREAFEHMRRVAYPAQWLTPEDAADATPGVSVNAIPASGAILTPSEGWVELALLINRLVEELRSHGGEVVTGAGRSRVEVTGARVSAVLTDTGGRIPVDAALLATGAAVPATLAELGVNIPQSTSIGLLVRTAPVNTPLRAVLNTPRVAVRPTPYGFLALDSGWSEREVVTHDDGTYQVREDTVQGLLREASAVLDGHPALSLASYGVGPKPIPGDGEPVLGQLQGLAGYHIAFTHSGATLALIAGELLADEIVQGEPHPMLVGFRPGRLAAVGG